jgi:hypothetical protein
MTPCILKRSDCVTRYERRKLWFSGEAVDALRFFPYYAVRVGFTLYQWATAFGIFSRRCRMSPAGRSPALTRFDRAAAEGHTQPVMRQGPLWIV